MPVGTRAGARRDARHLVVQALLRDGALSRAQLARRTTLAPSTVSAVTADLLAEGAVAEQEAVAPSGATGGRPATLLSLTRSAGVVVGVDLGKRHVRVAVAGLEHEVLAERYAALAPRPGPAEQVGVVADLTTEALAEAGLDRSAVLGVGVGVPGPVRAGRLSDPGILPGWGRAAVADLVGSALGAPAEAENDANLGVLSEWMWGAGRGCPDLVHLKLSTGIGAGLVLGGRPFAGATGAAGELGHVVVDPGGPPCPCGNRGCLDTVAGGAALLAALPPRAEAPDSLAGLVGLALVGDPAAVAVVAEAGRLVGVCLGALCSVVNPRRVVVGGDLAAAGEVLLDPLRTSLAASALRSAAEGLELVVGELGERAEVLGAVALVLRSTAGVSALAASRPSR